MKMYAKNKAGKIKVWGADVAYGEGRKVYIDSWYGLQGGKMRTSRKAVTAKSQATDYEQAIFEMASMASKKYDEGYREAIEELDNVPVRPMLAHRFDENKDKVVYPALIQPKLNGVRCIAHRLSQDHMVFMSKKGKEYVALQAIAPVVIHSLEVGAKLDGEIYVHGWSLQRIQSAAKAVNEDTPKLMFWAYDFIPEDDVDCETRQAVIMKAFAPLPDGEGGLMQPNPKIVWTYTDIVNSEEDVKTFHDEAVKAGYEGAIVRNLSGVYEAGFHSFNLLKVKEFHDDEFEIVGFTYDQFFDERQRPLQLISFICKTEQGDTFKVTPQGTHEQRDQWYKEGESFIGKELTVRYQELSDDGIPLITTGLCVRDYED